MGTRIGVGVGIGGKNKSQKEVLIDIFDILSEKPILKNSAWVHEDKTNSGNDSLVKDTPVLNLSGSTCDVINHDAGMLIGTGDCTVLFSICITAAGTIFAKRAAADTTYLIGSYNAASKYIDLRIGNASAILTNQSTTVPTIEPDTWYDVALTRYGANADLWIGGVKLKTINSVPASIGSTEKVSFACWAYGSTKAGYLTGKGGYFIFDLRKWSNQEIIDLQVNGIFPTTPATIAKIYCANSGSTAHDISGNARHGALTNAQWTTDIRKPLHLLRGFSINSGAIIAANQAATADALGNSIQYPAGSGAVNGLPNKYNIPVNSDLNVRIPAGDYTYAQLDALTADNKYVIIDKSSNRITRIRVKKKSDGTNAITALTDNTVLTDNTYLA